MVPERIHIRLPKSGQLSILVESCLAEALLDHRIERSAGGSSMVLNVSQGLRKKRIELSPLGLGEHWNFDSATPAVSLLWHELEIAVC